jgi:HAD superfamily hydrolase (TIGR01458 family)
MTFPIPPQNYQDLNFIGGIRGFLIDLDGVLYVGDKITKGAPAAIEFLIETGYPFRCISNTTRKSRHSLARHLSVRGFNIPETHIFTPALAAAAYLKKTGKKEYYLLASGDVDTDFEELEKGRPDSKPDWVIIGDAGDNITYGNMNRAFRYLMEGAELMALECDRYWMTTGGLSLSAGPFVKALEYATGKIATLMGKPSLDFFNLALEDMRLLPEQVAMIGDDITTDIGGAYHAGMRSILVRTGKFRNDTLASAGIKPACIIDTFSCIQEIIRDGS